MSGSRFVKRWLSARIYQRKRFSQFTVRDKHVFVYILLIVYWATTLYLFGSSKRNNQQWHIKCNSDWLCRITLVVENENKKRYLKHYCTKRRAGVLLYLTAYASKGVGRLMKKLLLLLLLLSLGTLPSLKLGYVRSSVISPAHITDCRK